jgi:glutamate transport system permease protein
VTAPFVTDALGPRAQRRVAVVSVVAGVLVAGAVLVAVLRLNDKGQFDAGLWRPLGQWSVLRFLLLGLVNTVKAAVVAMTLSMVAATFLALGRLARNGPVRWLAGAYVEMFRAMPLILLMYFCALGLPALGVHLKPFGAVVLALTAYNSAVLGEIFRAGILSLERGQSEAASAIGLTYWQSMGRVIVPQAARRMIPAIVSQLVTLLKDTSLGTVIIYDELVRRSDQTRNFYANPLQVFALAAVAYVIVNFTLSRVARRLEVRQRRRFNAGAIAVTGIEDLAVMGAHAEATVTREAPAASAPAALF